MEDSHKEQVLGRARLGARWAQDVVDFILAPGLKADVRRLWGPVLSINYAHVIMLLERGLLSDQEARAIIAAVRAIEDEGPDGLTLDFNNDLYMNIERAVIQRAGEHAGGKLHLGRSRNDLYPTALRMALRGELLEILQHLLRVVEAEHALAEPNTECIMPGYTHMQQAQPITFAHYLVAHGDLLLRDAQRILRAYSSVDACPLGAGALAGTPFPIDRERTSALLGFSAIAENTLDAVASKDFLPEVAFALSQTMADTSRLVEDLILFNSTEFRFVELHDSYAGTSSIMPQKKNPSPLEHCRARTAHVYGNLMAVLSIMKGLPFMHCRDLGGEAPKAVWDALQTTREVLRLLAGIVSTVEPKRDVMLLRASEGYVLATDLADALVGQAGVSFRTAHTIVAKVVSRAVQENKQLAEVSAEMVNDTAVQVTGAGINITEADLRRILDVHHSVASRATLGGPAPAEVSRMIQARKSSLQDLRDRAKRKAEMIQSAERMLREAASNVLTTAQ